MASFHDRQGKTSKHNLPSGSPASQSWLLRFSRSFTLSVASRPFNPSHSRDVQHKGRPICWNFNLQRCMASQAPVLTSASAARATIRQPAAVNPEPSKRNYLPLAHTASSTEHPGPSTSSQDLGLYTNASSKLPGAHIISSTASGCMGEWTSPQQPKSITCKELYGLVPACSTWGSPS